MLCVPITPAANAGTCPCSPAAVALMTTSKPRMSMASNPLDCSHAKICKAVGEFGSRVRLCGWQYAHRRVAHPAEAPVHRGLHHLHPATEWSCPASLIDRLWVRSRTSPIPSVLSACRLRIHRAPQGIHSTGALGALTEVVGNLPGFLLEGYGDVEALATGSHELDNCSWETVLVNQQRIIAD